MRSVFVGTPPQRLSYDIGMQSSKGGVGIELDDGRVVDLGIEISSRGYVTSWNDNWDLESVELAPHPEGWILRVLYTSGETGCPPSAEGVRETWIGSVDGRAWKKVDGGEPSGKAISTLGC